MKIRLLPVNILLIHSDWMAYLNCIYLRIYKYLSVYLNIYNIDGFPFDGSVKYIMSIKFRHIKALYVQKHGNKVQVRNKQ
jgi:hypothetical protein